MGVLLGRPIIFAVYINNPARMHSQIPTISLYLSSYARSPVKYTNESTLLPSTHKNRPTAVDSSIISPMKDMPTRDRNLSSLILMASPAKPPPPKEKEERAREGLKDQGAEVTALNLSANIFMNSTTKFLKTFTQPTMPSPSPNPQQKKAGQKQRNKGKMGAKQQEGDQKCSKLMPLASKYVKSAQSVAPLSYPSKEKIQKIMRGDSLKKAPAQHNASSSSKLRKTLSRNRYNSSQSNMNPNRNESLPERSRSGSVPKLARRQSRTRELKFMEKRERSETSLTWRQPQKDPPAKIDAKDKKNLRPNLNQAKSADHKPRQATARPNNRNHNTRPLPYSPPTDNNIENAPSTLSNISEPRVTAKREGLKPIFTLPSGELPLQTPIKPPPPLQTNQSNKSNDPTSKPNNRPRNTLPSNISAIKQEKTSDIHSKPSAKSKQIVFHYSAKEEASTYVHENPTEFAAVCNNNDGGASRMSKNQSTKALGLSTVFKNYNNKPAKPQQTEEETKNDTSKPVNKKLESSKFIPLEPIPSSPSILSDRKSPLPSAVVSKRNIKTEPREDLSPKIDIKEPSIQPIPTRDKDNLSVQGRAPKKKGPCSPLFNVISKWTGRRLRDGLQQLKLTIRSSQRHEKQAAILVKETVNIHRVLYMSYLRNAVQKFKRISLSIPVNRKPNVSLNTLKSNAASIIFRILGSKYRDDFNSFKNVLRMTQALPVSSNQPTKTYSDNNPNKAYVLQQFCSIIQSVNKSKMKNGFGKLMVYSNSKKKEVPKQVVPVVRSTNKTIKPPRDYYAQKLTLTNAKQSIQSDVSRIQSRISEKRRNTDRQKARLIKKQQGLQSKNKTLDQQVKQKQQKNKSLKLVFEQSAQMRGLDNALPECESFVGILTQIYSSILRNNSQIIDPNQLFEKYSLSKEYQSPLQQQWEALVRNTNIKSSLVQFQGPTLPHRPKQALLSEQSLILPILRSYIRERYLWHCFHLAAEDLPPPPHYYFFDFFPTYAHIIALNLKKQFKYT